MDRRRSASLAPVYWLYTALAIVFNTHIWLGYVLALCSPAARLLSVLGLGSSFRDRSRLHLLQLGSHCLQTGLKLLSFEIQLRQRLGRLGAVGVLGGRQVLLVHHGSEAVA